MSRNVAGMGEWIRSFQTCRGVVARGEGARRLTARLGSQAWRGCGALVRSEARGSLQGRSDRGGVPAGSEH